MPRVKPSEPRRAATPPAAPGEGSVRFGPVNWLLLASALVVIGLGFVTLSRGSTVAAPLLLVLGYAVLIPLGIIR
jgi:hypothetical protein